MPTQTEAIIEAFEELKGEQNWMGVNRRNRPPGYLN